MLYNYHWPIYLHIYALLILTISLGVKHSWMLLQVGRNGAEGSCVNIPWSRGGVGDNDYIFAFQNLVIPIG